MNGTLSIVATPIGNLSDITYRAIETLQACDAILCEDTRVTGKLLKHYDISKPLISYHANSKLSKTETILDMLKSGKHLALVSDAGTPTISDPGVQLVDLIQSDHPDITITSIPGPSAIITALTLSGFSGNQFTFYGFLPHKKGRKTLFEEMRDSTRVSVCYESPHRIVKTLQSLAEIAPQKRLCIARELTKMYEQVLHGSAQEMLDYFEQHPDEVRGEFVLMIK